MVMALAGRLAQIQTDAGENVNDPVWRARLDQAGTVGDPAVAQMAELIAKTEAVEEAWAIRLTALPDDHPVAALVANPFAAMPGM